MSQTAWPTSITLSGCEIEKVFPVDDKTKNTDFLMELRELEFRKNTYNDGKQVILDRPLYVCEISGNLASCTNFVSFLSHNEKGLIPQKGAAIYVGTIDGGQEALALDLSKADQELVFAWLSQHNAKLEY
jgi:hypothetical protein